MSKYKSKAHKDVAEFKRFLQAQFEPSILWIVDGNHDWDEVKARHRVIEEIIERSYKHYAASKHWIRKADVSDVRTHKWFRKLIGDNR